MNFLKMVILLDYMAFIHQYFEYVSKTHPKMKEYEYSEKSAVDNTKEILIAEYGFLLPQLEDVNEVDLEMISISKIRYSPERIKSFTDKDLDFTFPMTLPKIIVLDCGDGMYHLIDGYHRLAQVISRGGTLILSIVMKKKK